MFLTASIIGFVLIFDLFTPSQLGNCYDIDTEKVHYVAVPKSGQIRKAIKSYNKEIGKVRKMVVEQLRIESGLLDCFKPNQTEPLKEMKWNAKNYLDVSKYDTKVTTVVLKLDDPALLLDAKSYSLLDVYFQPTFDLSKCSKPDARNPDSDKPFWNPLPRTSIPQIPGEQFDCQRARSMGGHTSYKLSIQNPTNIKSLRLNPSHLAHVHIIRGGIIDSEYGKVCTGTVYIHPEQCDGESPTNVVCSDRFGKLEFYDEVFVATQNWGNLVLHNTLENLPRIALLRDFLRDNVNIKIHIHQSGKTEEILDQYGISRKRLIRGSVKAGIVYLPQGGGCAHAHALSLQAMAEQVHTDPSGDRMLGIKTDAILFVEGSKTAYLAERNQTESLLQK